MPRHPRKKGSGDIFELVLPVVGLLALAFVFSPAFRQLIIGLIVLTFWLLIAAAIVLIAWAIWKWRKSKADVKPAEKSDPNTSSILRVLRDEKPAEREPIAAEWSLALLKQIEWHRFEHLIVAYERELGNDAELTAFGGDGGIQRLKRKRRPKLPFKPEKERLLRGPGESLKQRIELMDENMIYLLMGLLVVPVMGGFGVLAGMHKAGIGSPVLQIGLGLAVALGLVAAGSWYLAKEAFRRGNHYLGWFGERMTAEELEPLLAQGWQVFHDVPAESGKQEFNIDHVVVGPGGVFSIETKMRRKGHARPGRTDHEVRYDGKELSWPWAEDRYGLDQASRNATWLHDWLSLMTGERIEVRPVLVFPCWYVVPPNAVHPVSVIHTSYLAGFVNMRKDVLNPKQIDLLSRQLEGRCRDVEY